MRRLQNRGVFIPVLLIAAVASAHDEFATVEIKTTRVAGNIYMLEGRGGNIGVSVGPDGILIVDDQYAPLSEKIRDALRKLGSEKPKFILNTHWHLDHVGGNEAFGREGTIIAHDNVRKRLETKQELFGKVVEPLNKDGLPLVTFNDTLTVHFNGDEIRIVYFPAGHTDGDGVVFFPGANVVHMGDDMWAGMFPFVDLDHGGDVVGLTKNVEKVIAMLKPDVKIIPGHGPLSTLDDLKQFHAMLVETTDHVRKAIAAGKTLDQIKSDGLTDKWKSWSAGFIKTDRWLETVHKSLTRK